MSQIHEPAASDELDPCDQCGADANVACREGCDEMQDCRSIP